MLNIDMSFVGKRTGPLLVYYSRDFSALVLDANLDLDMNKKIFVHGQFALTGHYKKTFPWPNGKKRIIVYLPQDDLQMCRIGQYDVLFNSFGERYFNNVWEATVEVYRTTEKN